MGVGDHDAVRLVQPDDLVEPLGRGEPENGQGTRRDTSAETDELAMRDDLLREHRADGLDRSQQPIVREQALQIGDAAVGLEHLQGRVVPGVFVERHLAGRIARRPLERDRAAGAEKGLEALDRRFGHHGDEEAHPVGAGRADLPEVMRQRPGDGAQELLDDAVGECGFVAERHGVGEAVERDHELDPGPGRRQRQLESRDDAGGAIGPVDLLGRVAAKFDGAWLRLQRDDPGRQDIAGFAQAAVADRSHAARSARHEAADRGLALGRGMHAQFPAAGRKFGVDVRHDGAGCDPQKPGAVPFDTGHARQVEQNAAVQRHRLPVIAGAGAPWGQRDAETGAGRGDCDDVGLMPRHRDDLGGFPREFAVEDRAVPEEIPRPPPHHGRLVDQRHVADEAAEGGEVVDGGL